MLVVVCNESIGRFGQTLPMNMLLGTFQPRNGPGERHGTSATPFRNGRIFDGTGGEPLEGVEVLVDGERIAEVSDVPIRSEAAEVIDFRGCTLMPGLIDAHFHAIAVSPDIWAVEHMPESLLAQHARRLQRRRASAPICRARCTTTS